MTSRYAFPQSLKSITGAILTGLSLDRAACHLGHFLSVIAGEVLGVLPYFILAAFEASQAYAFDHQRLLECLFHLLVSSFWSVFFFLAGAI